MRTPGEMHIMDLAQTNARGSQLWVCRACARRVLLGWTPRHTRVVLVDGDAGVSHTGAPFRRADLSVVHEWRGG